MIAGGWEHFYHQADIGIRGVGSSIEEAFEQAGVALTAVMTEPASIAETEQVEISCASDDPEYLLVDWLNEIIYRIATEKLLLGRFEVKIENGRLTAKAFGEKIDIKKHKPAVEIKAATYSELKVYKNDDGRWVAQCVVDV